MKYTILSAERLDDILVTKVLYDFADGNTVTVAVPHFQPSDKQAVVLGIQNRFSSEGVKKDAAARCDAIAAELELNVPVET